MPDGARIPAYSVCVDELRHESIGMAGRVPAFGGHSAGLPSAHHGAAPAAPAVTDLPPRGSAAAAATAVEPLTPGAPASDAPAGMAVCDPGGHLVWVGTGAAALLDPLAALDSLVGRGLADLVHPDGRAEVAGALAGLVDGTGGTARLRLLGRDATHWLDLTLSRGPGAAIPAEAQPAVAAALVLVHVADATDDMVARQALGVLSENTLDIVAQIDSGGLVTWISPSVRSALGRDPRTLIGQELTSLVAYEDLLGLTDALAGAEPGQEPTTRVVRFRSASGAYRFMSVTARAAEPTHSASGSLTAIGMRDVTEELRAKRELARSEEQFRMAMLGAPEGMAVTDSQDRIVQANPALCELLGVSTVALIGHRFREFIPAEDREQVDQWRERLLRGQASIERCQHRLTGPTSEVWVDHSVGIMRDDLGNPQLFVHQFADRTAARRLEADLVYRASHDVHTGLANRDSLMTRLGQRLGSPPEASAVVGVLFCDIDNLKPVNDRYGHLVGDAVISTVANRLERAVRRQDVVARVGGDEFVIVLDHCQTLEELTIVARNVQTAASHPVETSAGPVDVTITVGAVLAASTADTDQALAWADQALYRAKGEGRNRFTVEDVSGV